MIEVKEKFVTNDGKEHQTAIEAYSHIESILCEGVDKIITPVCAKDIGMKYNTRIDIVTALVGTIDNAKALYGLLDYMLK